MTNDRPIKLEIEPIWLQQPNESTLWFDRLQRFLLIGSKRTLLGAYKAYRQEQEGALSPHPEVPESLRNVDPSAPSTRRIKTPHSWNKAFKKYRWSERAQAWDDNNRQIELEKWKGRDLERRERSWAAHDALMDKVEQMLNVPLFRQQVVRQGEDGRPQIIEVHPAEWKLVDVVRLLKAAQDAGIIAVGDVNSAIVLIEAMGLSIEDNGAKMLDNGATSLQVDNFLD